MRERGLSRVVSREMGTSGRKVSRIQQPEPAPRGLRGRARIGVGHHPSDPGGEGGG